MDNKEKMAMAIHNLCDYDQRSEHYKDLLTLDCIEADDIQKPRDNCACDYCHDGNDRLALALIETLEELQDVERCFNDVNF